MTAVYHYYDTLKRFPRRPKVENWICWEKVLIFYFIFPFFSSEYYNDKQNDFKYDFILFFRSFLIKNFRNSNKLKNAKTIYGKKGLKESKNENGFKYSLVE